MKKEARIQAEKMFLNAGGNITNREIAKAVSVNPLTVGRWKRDEKWDVKLRDLQKAQVREAGGGVVRKKAARDEAFRIYMEAGGNITNKELATRVRVSPATISKWKEQDNWIEQIKIQPVEPVVDETVAEAPELDLGDLAAPEQIIEINRKIGGLLNREHLSAEEIAFLSDAKRDLLEALEVYLGIVRDVGTIKLGE